MEFNELDKNLRESYNSLKVFHDSYYDVHRDGESVDAELALNAFYRLEEFIERLLKS